MRLVFPGVGEQELRNNFNNAQSFGTSVQDAVVRSVGVSPGRIVLQDVLVTPASNEKKSPSAVVTLSLLPDERLLSTEPSAQELADEIRRQLSQNTSYLTRQLRLVLPELSDVFLQADGAKAVVLAGDNPQASSSTVRRPPFGVDMLCVIFVGVLIWL